jgi:4-carboxymuconolactone decarboxylase
MTDTPDRLAAGMKTRRTVLGDTYVDAAVARTTDLNRDFQSYITESAWNDIWNRPVRYGARAR